MSTNVGERIRYHRKARGMSSEQLAVAAGLSMATIQRVESGKHSPRVDNLVRIVDALGIEFPEFLKEIA